MADTTTRFLEFPKMSCTDTQARPCPTRLRLLFEMVENPDDWRAPIDEWIPESAFNDVALAVEYFTATTLATVDRHVDDAGVSHVRVRADGYRNGPAGP